MRVRIEIVGSNPKYRGMSGDFEYPHLEDAIDDLARRTGLEAYEVLRRGNGRWTVVAHDEGPARERPDVRKKPGEYSRSM